MVYNHLSDHKWSLREHEQEEMMAQKQWLFSDYDLSNLQLALATEIDRLRSRERPVQHHLKNLEKLAEKLAAIREATGRVFNSDDDMDGEPCEQLLVSLIEKEVGGRWEDPYTVIPVGKRWAVVLKADPGQHPQGEKTHPHSTHAYRACRRLNAAYWENEARAAAEKS
jgi:hypothetical protein